MPKVIEKPRADGVGGAEDGGRGSGTCVVLTLGDVAESGNTLLGDVGGGERGVVDKFLRFHLR